MCIVHFHTISCRSLQNKAEKKMLGGKRPHASVFFFKYIFSPIVVVVALCFYKLLATGSLALC